MQLTALYYADSRASLVAVLSGLSFAIISKFKISLSRYRYKLIPIFLISAIIGAIALFQYRSGSANARLLIWKVSGAMIKEKPVFGHGIGHFEKKYMLYQADYFSQYPESRFAILANNVSSPYNELLRIGVEQGIIGVLFILFLFCSLFYYRPKDISDLISKSGLIALAAFSMFSYPGDTLSLLILFSIFIGLNKSASVFSLDFSKWGIRSIHIVNITVFITCIPYFFFYTKASIHTARVMSDRSQLLLNPEEQDRLMKNTSFSVFYAYYIRHTHEEGNDYQKIISDIIPSCENYCFLGDIFLSSHRYAHAESYYRKAAYMIPCRLTPNYKLWNLYLQKGDTARAIEIAEYMLEQKLKVENSFTIRSKSEIRKFLAGVNDQNGN
ncbi:MAG: O-antigen ligase family protein [Bacteroidales bacterium]